VWNVVVPQMGYWLAAFPSSSGSVTAVGALSLESGDEDKCEDDVILETTGR